MEHASLQTFVRHHEETSEAQAHLTLGDHTPRSVSGIGASVSMRYVISPMPFILSVKREKKNLFTLKMRKEEYDESNRNYPDFARITAIDSFLDGRSGRVCTRIHAYRVLTTTQEQVWFARARFGHYDLIDFVVVLIGYTLSGEETRDRLFTNDLLSFASPFMALFGRSQLPPRSTLSRFLAALDQPPVEALRTLFQKDLLAWKSFPSP